MLSKPCVYQKKTRVNSLVSESTGHFLMKTQNLEAMREEVDKFDILEIKKYKATT